LLVLELHVQSGFDLINHALLLIIVALKLLRGQPQLYYLFHRLQLVIHHRLNQVIKEPHLCLVFFVEGLELVVIEEFGDDESVAF